MADAPSRWAIAPYFVVEDVVATAEYYRDRLGFRYDRLWGEPPTFEDCNGYLLCSGHLLDRRP